MDWLEPVSDEQYKEAGHWNYKVPISSHQFVGAESTDLCSYPYGPASFISKKEITQMQNSLSEQQQAIIPIAAYAANGDLAKLSQSLKDGLDLG